MASKIKYILTIFFLIPALFLVVVIRGEDSPIRKELSALPLFSLLISERDEIKGRARMTVLNHAIPPAGYLAQILDHPPSFKREVVSGYNGYLDYYKKVIEYFPNNADAYAMMGFCYYYLGEFQNAISWYQKAVYLNPQFFWNYYNLGVLYFHQGQYARAVGEFKKALSLKWEGTVKIIYLSKVYQQIFSSYEKGYDVQKELKKGYYKCSLLMALGYICLSGQKSSSEVQKIFQKTGESVQAF